MQDAQLSVFMAEVGRLTAMLNDATAMLEQEHSERMFWFIEAQGRAAMIEVLRQRISRIERAIPEAGFIQ